MKTKSTPKEEMLEKIKQKNKENKKYYDKFQKIAESYANDIEIEQQQVSEIKNERISLNEGPKEKTNVCKETNHIQGATECTYNISNNTLTNDDVNNTEG